MKNDPNESADVDPNLTLSEAKTAGDHARKDLDLVGYLAAGAGGLTFMALPVLSVGLICLAGYARYKVHKIYNEGKALDEKIAQVGGDTLVGDFEQVAAARRRSASKKSDQSTPDDAPGAPRRPSRPH